MIPKLKRYVSEGFLAFVRMQPCFICGHKAEPHHYRSRGSFGSDLESIPLCRKHHSECEQVGRLTFVTKHYFSPAEFFDRRITLLQDYIMDMESLMSTQEDKGVTVEQS